MPHTRLMADAVLRIVARDGLDAVTAPAVAAETKRSCAWAERQLTAEELLLRLSLTHTIDVLDRRIAAHAGEPAVAGVLGAMAEEALPGRPDEFARRRGWLAMLARAAAGPDLDDPVRNRFAATHRGIREGLGRAEPRASREALATAALIDGLTAHVMIGACTPRQASEALAAHLAR